MNRISTLRFTRDVYKIGSAPGRTYYDIERIRAEAKALLADPESAMSELGISDLDGTFGVIDE